jgi:hypothetical protein
MATIHPDELDLYLKGAQIRNEKEKRAAESGRQPSENQRQRENEALQQFD